MEINKILPTFLFILLTIIKNSLQKEEILFNQNFTIKFAEVIDLKLNLTELDLEDKIINEKKPFLNLIAKVKKPDNCDNSRSVS